MLSIQDIVDLAKAGYKPADVKELITLSQTTQEPVTIAPEQGQSEGVNSAEAEQPAETKEQKPVIQPVEPQETIDYKKLYEDSQNRLANIQMQNTRQNIQSEQVNDLQLVEDIVQGFM